MSEMKNYIIVECEPERPHFPLVHLVKSDDLTAIKERCAVSMHYHSIFTLEKDENAPVYNAFGGTFLRRVVFFRPGMWIKTRLLQIASEMHGMNYSAEQLNAAMEVAVEVFSREKLEPKVRTD